jgi:heme-degrading monooxygenase HmoA
MTHVRVATYSVEPGNSSEWLPEVENGILPIYRDHAGFQSFALVEAGDTIVSITYWDSQEHAQTASEAGSRWAKGQSFIKGQTSLHVGEEVAGAR